MRLTNVQAWATRVTLDGAPCAPVVGISGSLRSGSLNSALLRARARRVPAGVEVVVLDIGDLPLYAADRDHAGGPERRRVQRSRQPMPTFSPRRNTTGARVGS